MQRAVWHATGRCGGSCLRQPATPRQTTCLQMPMRRPGSPARVEALHRRQHRSPCRVPARARHAQSESEKRQRRHSNRRSTAPKRRAAMSQAMQAIAIARCTVSGGLPRYRSQICAYIPCHYNCTPGILREGNLLFLDMEQGQGSPHRYWSFTRPRSSRLPCAKPGSQFTFVMK